MARKIVYKKSGLNSQPTTPNGYKFVGYEDEIFSEKDGDIITPIGEPFDCKDLDDCPTIKDIKQSIDGIKPFDCKDLDDCPTIIDIKQTITDIKPFDCKDLDDCPTIKDIKQSIEEMKPFDCSDLDDCSTIKDIKQSITDILQRLDDLEQ